MLSRAANNLYWMSRHIERAENTARLLDVTYRMSLLPYRVQESDQAWAEPWALPLVINGLASAYYERYPGPISSDDVLRFMVLDSTNPSSIHSCIQAARENARTERCAMFSMRCAWDRTWLPSVCPSGTTISAATLGVAAR